MFDLKKNDEPTQENVKLSPPWLTYVHEVYALFEEDPEVAVAYDETKKVLTLLVESGIKADALGQLLPPEIDFGGVKLQIEVVPANDEHSAASLFRHAFSGNPIFSRVETVDGIFASPLTYVVFEPAIAQFYDDNLGDVNGMKTALVDEIARDVFTPQVGLFFCTDLVDDEE